MSPPHILDFGKAYLDSPPDYDPIALEDSMDAFRAYYESDAEWDQILEVVAILRSFGIFYYDLKPGNIRSARTAPYITKKVCVLQTLDRFIVVRAAPLPFDSRIEATLPFPSSS